MSYIEKITKSRYNLKKYLQTEWDVSTMPDYSEKEIEKIYTLNANEHPELSSFGHATGCNFSVKHKFLPSYKLHIIYYNFPELNTKHVKITISDDGPGFPEDVSKKIGQPYIATTSKDLGSKAGLGLGTFIGKTLLERKKANLNFSNLEKKEGAIVTIIWKNSDIII